MFLKFCGKSKSIICLCLLLNAGLLSDDSCEDGWIHRQRHCYYIEPAMNYNGAEARQICQDLGSELVGILFYDSTNQCLSIILYIKIYMY